MIRLFSKRSSPSIIVYYMQILFTLVFKNTVYNIYYTTLILIVNTGLLPRSRLYSAGEFRRPIYFDMNKCRGLHFFLHSLKELRLPTFINTSTLMSIVNPGLSQRASSTGVFSQSVRVYKYELIWYIIKILWRMFTTCVRRRYPLHSILLFYCYYA